MKRPRPVEVTVDQSIVIRPGDVVLVGIDDRFGDAFCPETADRIRERLAPHMPEGARLLFWPCPNGKSVCNLSWLAQQLLGQRGYQGENDGRE